MLGQAEALGCAPTNPHCICNNANFAYGVRDCANQACPSSADASTVISFGVEYCENASSSTSANGAASTSAKSTTSSATSGASTALPGTTSGRPLSSLTTSTVPSTTTNNGSSSRASPTSTSAAHGRGLSAGAKAGIGVGVGIIGLILLAAALYATYWFGRRHERTARNTNQSLAAKDGSNNPTALDEGYRELDGNGRPRQELPTRHNVHELDGQERRGELPEK